MLNPKLMELVHRSMVFREARLIKRRVLSYLVANAVQDAIVEFSKSKPQANYSQSSNIWMFWTNKDGGKMLPPLIQVCWDSVDVHLPGRRRGLGLDEAVSMTELSGSIVDNWRTGKLITAHLADILRWELLSRYGGTWLDSTVFLSGQPAFLAQGVNAVPKFTKLPNRWGVTFSNWALSFPNFGLIPSLASLANKVIIEHPPFLGDYFQFQIATSLALNYSAEGSKEYESLFDLNHVKSHVLANSVRTHENNKIALQDHHIHKLSHKSPRFKGLNENQLLAMLESSS